MFVKHVSICLIEGLLCAGHCAHALCTLPVILQGRWGIPPFPSYGKGSSQRLDNLLAVCLLPKPGLFPMVGQKEQKGVDFFPEVTHEQFDPLIVSDLKKMLKTT